MIIDAYTHVWESLSQLGRAADQMAARAAQLRQVAACEPHESPGHEITHVSPPRHLAACARADFVIVAGFRSQRLEVDIPNTYIADFVRQHPDKLIGFAGIDPANPEQALSDIDEARELGLPGVALAPSAQGFHPSSSGAYQIYEKLQGLAMPVVVHHGLYFCAQHQLEYARPVLYDEVARDFPDLRMVLTHLGAPWTEEAFTVLAKHDNLYAELSGVLTQPWRAYTTLLSAYESGVLDKLLFASGFPITTTERALESIYRVNRICHGTSLPVLPREQLRAIVERDTLTLLGLPSPSPQSLQAASAMMVADPDSEPA